MLSFFFPSETMANLPKLSALTSNKTAKLRYSYRDLAEGFFYKTPVSDGQIQAFVGLVEDPEVDLCAIADLQVKWESHKRHRTQPVTPLETTVELALHAGLLRYVRALQLG